MNIRNKVIAVVVGILLIISLIVGGSYAYFMHVEEIEDKVMASSDCFEITFEGDNAITLRDVLPMSSYPEDMEPYTFTIKNICNHAINYDVNLEALEGSTMDESQLGIYLNGSSLRSFDSFYNNESDFVNPNAISSYHLKTAVLNPGEEKNYELKIYLSSSSTVEKAAGKKYIGKIAVNATLNKYKISSVMIPGSTFRDKISNLVPSDADFETIEVVDKAPSEDANKINVSISEEYPIYAWYDTDRVKLYSTTGGITLNPESSSMFSNLRLKHLDLSKFDFSIVLTMNSMFYGMPNVMDINFSSIDTHKVRNMLNMFYEIGTIEELYFDSLDTSNVETMEQMFYRAKNLKKITFKNFTNEKVKKMNYMFGNMPYLEEIDFSGFYTPSVKEMQYMFDGSKNLKKLDLSTFDTSNVTNMYRMFAYTSNLREVNVSSFNVSNVMQLDKLFQGSGIEVLDLSSFDISPDAEIRQFFYSMSNLRTIYVSHDWDITKDVYLFTDDYNLVGGAGTSYANNKEYNKGYIKYAVIDDPDNGKPGYFTLKEN